MRISDVKKVLKSTIRVLAFSCLTINTHLLSEVKAEQPDTEDSNPGGLCTVHSNRFRGGGGVRVYKTVAMFNGQK